MTEEELSEIRAEQEKLKENPGIYGKWAKSRELTYEQIEVKHKVRKALRNTTQIKRPD